MYKPLARGILNLGFSGGGTPLPYVVDLGLYWVYVGLRRTSAAYSVVF